MDWNVGYFSEQVGGLDPLIPAEDREKWVNELSSYTDDSGYELINYETALHGFSIKYSQAFYTLLAIVYGNGADDVIVDENNMIIGVPNVILWEQERQDDAFARIEELFEKYMLDPYVPGKVTYLFANFDGYI